MNNLKRVLSLALASVMLIGMMAVSASAADFTDEADIENKDAVGTMVALNIISGYPDGSYQPDGLLTRAEAAKMIFVALNGGKTSESLTTKAVPTFTDIKGNWAEGYIEWAAAEKQGIIAGMGDGTFNPKGNLTGTQLAKMMLVAIGYSAKAEGLEGTNDWALNTNSLALSKGFFDDLDDINPEEFITRDQAALLILNACSAPMVEYQSYLNTNGDGSLSTTLVAQNRKDAFNQNVTILSDKYDADTKEVYLTKASYNSTTKKYSYTVGTLLTGAGTNYNFTSEEDYTSLYAQPVKFLASLTGTTVDKFYGMYNNGATLETTRGAITAVSTTAKTFKVDGASKKTDTTAASASAMTIYIGKDTTDATNGKNLAYNTVPASKVIFVDVDGDAEYEYGIMTEAAIEKVTYVSSTTATVGSNSYTLKNVNVYDGIAKDDYAVVTTDDFTGKVTLTKAETVNGKIAAVKDGDSVQIDGTWYKRAGAAKDAVDSVSALAATNIGDTYTLTVVDGFYYASKKDATVAAATDILFIASVDEADVSLGTATAKAKVYFLDGTTANVIITKVNGEKLVANISSANDVTKLSGSNLVTDTVYRAATNTTTDVVEGGLYTYTKDSSGNYELHTLSDVEGEKASYEIYTQADSAAHYDNTTKKFFVKGTDNYVIDDDAVIFAMGTAAAGQKIKVVSGKTMKTWGSTEASQTGSVQVLANVVNGFTTIKVASFISNSFTTISDDSTAHYGYVVSDEPVVVTNSDNAKVANVTVWNGTENVDIQVLSLASSTAIPTAAATAAASEANGLAAGDFVTYELDSKGYAINYGPYGVAQAVSALSGKNLQLKIDGNTATDYVINDDTKYIYVDVANGKGVEGGELTMATATEYAVSADATIYFNNVVVASGSAGSALKVVFVDIANKIEGAGAAVAAKVSGESGYAQTIIDPITFTTATKAITIKTDAGNTLGELNGASLVTGADKVIDERFKNVWMAYATLKSTGAIVSDGTVLDPTLHDFYLLGTNGVAVKVTLTSVASD